MKSVETKELVDFLLSIDGDASHKNALIAHYMGVEIDNWYAIGTSILVWKKRTIDKIKLDEYKKKNPSVNLMSLPHEEADRLFGIDEWNNIDDGFNGLYFHLDWNLLMNVVDKIESIENNRYGFDIHVHGVQIVDYKEEEAVSISVDKNDNDSKIDMVYQAVVSFIRRELKKINK